MEEGKVENVSDVPAVEASGDAAPDSQAVSYESHKRLLSEKKRRDEEVRAQAKRIQELEAADKARIENEARQKEDWKKMLDMREQELADTQERYQALESQVHLVVKKAAFKKALGGTFKDNYERLIDYSSIPIDPTTNSVDELALNKYVEQFKKDFREVIVPMSVPGVSQAAPQSATPSRGKSDILADFAKFLK